MTKTKNINAVFFDLDGTLLDTVSDLVFALNLLRQEEQLPELEDAHIRPIANLGSRAMLKRALDVDETHHRFKSLREKFLSLYQENIANSTRFFPNIDRVLNYLDENYIPWGIVTNKPTKPTMQLLKAINFDHRPACVICGDTLSKAKPFPDPLLRACQLLKKTPQESIFIGDAHTDILAGKAAKMRSLVALYGYIDTKENPIDWQADGYINEPLEIIDWIGK